MLGARALKVRGEADIGRRLTAEVNRRVALSAGLALCAEGLTGCAPRRDRQATSGSIVRAAEREGEVVIYSNTNVFGPVGAGFAAVFPKVKIRFVEITSRAIQARITSETATGKAIGDVVWSSSMDIQVKLINDGYAQTYSSPEARNLPGWAVWRDQGFGTTAEPIVFAYNKRLLSEADVPRSHAALLEALRKDPDRWRGKIALYDPEKSGVGFLYMSTDTQIYPDAWALLAEIGKSQPGLYVPGAALMRQVASGQHLLAFDMNRSYADTWAMKPDADIAHLIPSDYHLLISRVAFIAKSAPHPNAARVFLDYLMSEDGQQKLAQARLTPIRPHAGDPPIVAGGRPIKVGPALLANFDQARRAQMLARWRETLVAPPSP
jgi:iron(III) transport system substrate-binding protein